MRITKLVVGILMIVLSVFIVFQSMAAGLLNAIENKGATSGSAGILMALAYLISGIVYLATKSKKGLGGDIANAIILGLFGVMALASANKSFGDLMIWIVLGFIIGLGFLIWHLLTNRGAKNNIVTDQYMNNGYNQSNGQQSQYPSRLELHSRRHH
ncbi:hypothetical protein ACFQAV_12050 [Companilactobacillus huachuanensis]|uniref:MFS transporter n=1 Tax=Companilactobacillus huachuanensis TaxID=2559914 RepID=A0ABW1RQ65_9LACO|nr:hypothetical protein [Companilactobacillus huachuanensis]